MCPEVVFGLRGMSVPTDSISNLRVASTAEVFGKVLLVQFSSVAKSCPALCDHMDCSTPGLPVHHQSLLKVMSIESVMPSTIILCRPLLLPPSIFPASGSFQMTQFFASGGQSFGVSASASVLPMNIQDWFTLGWTSWISFQSKGLSRVFFNTTVQKHQFFGAQLSL